MRSITWKTRPKKASLSASSDTASSVRGTSSWIQSTERGLFGGAGVSAVIFGAPSAKRRPYCPTHGSDRSLSTAAIDSNGGSAGACDAAGSSCRTARR